MHQVTQKVIEPTRPKRASGAGRTLNISRNNNNRGPATGKGGRIRQRK